MVKTLLTTLQTAAGFKVTDMTIYTWRAGTATKEKLPTVKGIPGAARAVRFDAAEMKKYAKFHGIQFNLGAALSVIAEPAKMGPKTLPVKKALAAKKVVQVVVASPAKAAKKVAAKKAK